MKKNSILVVIVVASFAPVHGQTTKEIAEVDGVRAKRYVTHLSSDEMQGRESCTEGYRKAADWVASQFKDWGLKPAGEQGTFFQEVEIPAFVRRTGVPTLKIRSRDFPWDDGDFLVHPESTADTTVKGTIVFVGYGISAPEKGLDEYADVDVQGQIVLVLKGSPKDAPAPKGMFVKSAESGKDTEIEEWKEESTDVKKLTTAYEQGAAAVLLHDPDKEGKRERSSGATTSTFKPERKFLCFHIQERVFRAIMKQDSQESPSGLKRRLRGIRQEIKEKKPQSFATDVDTILRGYDQIERHNKENGNHTARNVLAKIEGTDPKLKNEYVIVGAHLDHIGIRNGYVYNGADDNASGSAVVMEVARVLSESRILPKRTLLFCCWCGEERGMIGSLHYTDEPCDSVTMDQVTAYFNLDMVGMGKDLRAMGGLNFPAVWDVIIRGQDDEVIKRITPSEGGQGGSDHTGFIKRGIEAIMLISSGGVGHRDFHQPEDDAEKIDPEMLRLAGRFVLNGMTNLANETEVELLVPRRKALYRGMRMKVANVNPGLEGSQWIQIHIEEKDKAALQEKIYAHTRELLNGKKGQERRDKKSLARGSTDLAVVGDDEKLMSLVVDFHGIGRADLEGDDGMWVVSGRLTEDGKVALKTLEECEVVVRLISPGEELIHDMLSAAKKPFIITGDYAITDRMADRLNRRDVMLGVDLNPKEFDDFISRVEELKSVLGMRTNLFAYLTAKDGLDEAKRPLYLRLIDLGWCHREICGTREQRGLVGGASMATSSGRR